MSTSAAPQVGQPAPYFSGRTDRGEDVSLEQYLGRWLLLYFYPRDDTPGCTRQACNLRDHFEQLEEEGIAVLGVSADDESAHQKFVAKYDLPFPLLADTHREVIDAYGAWGQKSMYGIKREGIVRTSFLIDPRGTLRYVFGRPKAGEHAEEVLQKKHELEG
jgi:thioredoxin-dependent peroxiredoxin